jgi:hypothetical protein
MLGIRAQVCANHRSFHRLRQLSRVLTTGADLRYVSPPASDAAGQVKSPAEFPRTLYPEIEPIESGHIHVGDGHQVRA